MAEVRISLSYDDLRKLIGEDDTAMLDMRNAIIKTFTEQYLMDNVRSEIAKTDNGAIRKAVESEFASYFTARSTFGSYAGLHDRVKLDLNTHMKEVQGSMIASANAATLTQAMNHVAQQRKAILELVEEKVQKEIAGITEAYIRSLVSERIHAIYTSIKNDTA